jgi:FtsP/CotA-like multicopper oxidase with cupredoxin domain
MVCGRVTGVASVTLVSALVVFLPPESPPRPAQRPRSDILSNDQRVPAGELRDGVLTIDLLAAAGSWSPEEGDGPEHTVYAFGEGNGELRIPGPLLRVPVGTEVHARIRNAIVGATLVVHGLHDRPGAPDALHVPPGGRRSVRFRVTDPGTYFYWATTRNARTVRDRFGMESQLHGALIVDPEGAVARDAVLVIGIEDDSAAVPADRRLRAAVVNGRSWPHAPTATVTAGDTVRMRWINASDRSHPMHLHGFYFRVDGRGTSAQDTLYAPAQQRLVVTELLLPGQTMALTWVPERPGNWLMHCHMAAHISPELRLGTRRTADGAHAHNHALDAMAGIVTGWQVRPNPRARPAASPRAHARRLRLVAQSAPGRYGPDPGLGFVLQTEEAVAGRDSIAVPGPPIVLVRDEPVQITVVNRLAEPTSIHWHGIELESYFDGVSGWSGEPGRVAPHIEPGDSFVVHFTPPRAGTFIYHTHFEEARQLASGMYGPLIVLEPGAAYDPQVDQVWVLSQNGPAQGVRVMLNGSSSPRIELQATRPYRVRVININPNVPLILSLLADSVPVTWRAIAKDGADLPEARMQPAVLRIGVGETYDFDLTPDLPRAWTLRAVDLAGTVRLSGLVDVRPTTLR